MFQYTRWMFVHLTQKVLSSATISNEISCCTFLVKNHFVCVLSTTVDCNLFNNHRSKELVGGNYNVLIYYQNASAPDPEGVVLYNTLSNEIYIVVHFWSKIILFVYLPQQRIVSYSTTTETKKWQEATVMFQDAMRMLVHLTQKGVVLCNTFK